MPGINGYIGLLKDITKGNTVPITLTIKKNGVAENITGAKFYITMDKKLESLTVPEKEIIILPTDAVNGVAVGEISDAETMSLDISSYFYAIKYITASGKTHIIDMGKIKVLHGVDSRIAND